MTAAGPRTFAAGPRIAAGPPTSAAPVRGRIGRWHYRRGSCFMTCGDLLVVTTRHVLQRVADQMDGAGLHPPFGVDCVDRRRRKHPRDPGAGIHQRAGLLVMDEPLKCVKPDKTAPQCSS
jgi:hypothetical protein